MKKNKQMNFNCLHTAEVFRSTLALIVQQLSPSRWQSPSGGTAHLLQLGQSQRVAVLGSELHEPHVGWVRELGDDAEAGEQPDSGGGREKERCCLKWSSV